MSKSNYDIAHEFFYADGACKNYSYKSVSYEYDRFYSYYTVIGELKTAKNGETIFLLSYWNMSPTTTRHISYLWSANPFKMIRVPFEYGEHGDISPETLAKRCLEYLEKYAKSKLTRKENRTEFFNFYEMLNDLNDNFKTGVKMPKKFIELFNTLNDSEGVKKIKAKQLEIERKTAAAVKRAFNKLTKNKTIKDLAKLAYSYDSPATPEERAKIKKALNPNNDLSFVWQDAEGNFKTSQHITIKAEEGRIALKLWKAGKLKHGMQIGYYTILQITKDFVKIGCHKIPVANLNELEG